MKISERKYPLFALCGLNCGLCPRYQTDGASKCPGCGGPDFRLKHPSCGVLGCNKKRDNVDFCFQCSLYPCERYRRPNKADSFITYKNVVSDFAKAKKAGVGRYLEALNRKIEILELLIKKYNDGRRKSFYCLAVNLLGLPELEKIMIKIEAEIDKLELSEKERAKAVVELFESVAKKNKIGLAMRKQ